MGGAAGGRETGLLGTTVDEHFEGCQSHVPGLLVEEAGGGQWIDKGKRGGESSGEDRDGHAGACLAGRAVRSFLRTGGSDPGGPGPVGDGGGRDGERKGGRG